MGLEGSKNNNDNMGGLVGLIIIIMIIWVGLIEQKRYATFFNKNSKC